MSPHLLAAILASEGVEAAGAGAAPAVAPGVFTKLPMLELSVLQPVEIFVLMALAVAANCSKYLLLCIVSLSMFIHPHLKDWVHADIL